ncbi:hypothetical protein ACHAPT_002390 [Fusarium lateritium]
MPVTLYPANHPAAPWTKRGAATSSLELLQKSCPDEHERSQRIIQSSFDDIPGNGIFPESNGFVDAAWWAYSQHHHLQIRPEDVWFSILTQLSFYINRNAEQLRSHFVAHRDRKEVKVCVVGSTEAVDFGQLAVIMTEKMEEHIVDPKLRKWVMPDFTTTEATDKVTAAILMMGSMQSYFSYTMCVCCGLPSVTLLGTKDDWREIRNRVDKIPQFGAEAEQFTKLLRPVLDRLVLSFDNPLDPDILDFWGRIAHWEQNGSGPDHLSGWITAFCFWTPEGRCLHHKGLAEDIYDTETKRYHAGCNIDGIQFHHLDIEEIPKGFVSVPVKLIDDGVEIKTRMVAGSVGVKVWSSEDVLRDTPQQHGKAVTEARPRTRREQKKKKKAEKVAHLREFVSRLICLSRKETRDSTSAAPGKGSALKETASSSGTPSTPQVPQEELKPILDSVQPVSGWWMYELKKGRA